MEESIKFEELLTMYIHDCGAVKFNGVRKHHVLHILLGTWSSDPVVASLNTLPCNSVSVTYTCTCSH